MYSTSNKTCHMCHISHQENIVTSFLGCSFGNICHSIKIWNFHKGRVAHKDDFWRLFHSPFLELVIIDITICRHTIVDEIINFSRTSYRRAVSQMPTIRQPHRQNLITRLAPCKINRLVSICARMGLYISMVSMEQTHRTGNREPLDSVNISLSTIIAIIWQYFFRNLLLRGIQILSQSPSIRLNLRRYELIQIRNILKRWVTFGILIRQNRAHCPKHARRHIVLTRNELKPLPLTIFFLFNQIKNWIFHIPPYLILS